MRSRFCSDCGARLREDRAIKDDDGRAKLYADIAHPINCDCREMIQRRVIIAFEEELEKSKQPGYLCTYDDYGEENYATLSEETEEALDLPRILPVDESLRRRDHSNYIPEPHARAPEREPVSLSFRQQGEVASDDPFGAGII